MTEAKGVKKRCRNCTTILEPKALWELPKGFFCDVVCAREWWSVARFISRVADNPLLITALKLHSVSPLTLYDIPSVSPNPSEVSDPAEEATLDPGTPIAFL